VLLVLALQLATGGVKSYVKSPIGRLLDFADHGAGDRFGRRARQSTSQRGGRMGRPQRQHHREVPQRNTPINLRVEGGGGGGVTVVSF
jgi:hypothetical protein